MRHASINSTASSAQVPARSNERSGGFLLTRQQSNVVHVRLIGRLSVRTLREIDRRIRPELKPGTTSFLILDAAELQHIPVSVAVELMEQEPRWRSLGIVALWVGLSPYLSDLLNFACGHEPCLPALGDVETACVMLEELADRPASVARGWLEANSDLVH